MRTCTASDVEDPHPGTRWELSEGDLSQRCVQWLEKAVVVLGNPTVGIVRRLHDDTLRCATWPLQLAAREVAVERSSIDVSKHIQGLPDDVRGDIEVLDQVISSAMSGLERVLYVGRFWGGSDQEIIGYGPYSYERSDKSTVDWFVVGLAVQKNYLSVYLSAVEDGEYVSEKYGKELGKVKVGKSSLSFRGVDDIDLDKLAELVSLSRELSAEYLA